MLSSTPKTVKANSSRHADAKSSLNKGKEEPTVDQLAEQLSQLLDEFMYNVVSAADQDLDTVMGYDVMMDRYDEMINQLPEEHKKTFDDRLASIISSSSNASTSDLKVLKQRSPVKQIGKNSAIYASGFSWADCDQDSVTGDEQEPSILGYARLPSSAGSSPRKSHHRSSPKKVEAQSLKSAVETVLAANDDESSLKRRNSVSVSRAGSKRKKKPRKKQNVPGANFDSDNVTDNGNDESAVEVVTSQPMPLPPSHSHSAPRAHVTSPKSSHMPPLIPQQPQQQHGYNDRKESFADFRPSLSRSQIKNRKRAASRRNYDGDWRAQSLNDVDVVHEDIEEPEVQKYDETMLDEQVVSPVSKAVRVNMSTMTDEYQDEPTVQVDDVQTNKVNLIPEFKNIFELMVYNYEQALKSAFERPEHCIVYEPKRL